MMRPTWQGSAGLLLAAMVFAGCGGGGSEDFIEEIRGTPNVGVTPGPRGDAAVIEFVVPGATGAGLAAAEASSIEFESEIGPVGSSNPQASLVQFRVLNAEGRPARNGIRVVFTLEGPADAVMTISEDRTDNGVVSTIVRAGATPGNATVLARVRGTELAARSAVIVIGRSRGAAAAIEFFGLRTPALLDNQDGGPGTPQSRTQLGVRGAGFNQAVDVVFVVLDAHGAAAVDGTIVDFRLFGPNGGEFISPTSNVTADGFVAATIFTGARPGPVQVEAQVRDTGIRARAIPITIGSALNPSATNFSIAARCLNVAGLVTFGLEDEIRAGFSDQFGNPLPIGSAVSFHAEGGVIQAQGITPDGIAATAKLVTQAPIPADRRVTVLAVTTGQESFTDLNGNGRFDLGEPFVDLPPEVFLDANEDGSHQAGEFFIDNNNNGVFDATPNGIWDDQIMIDAQMPIIFSGPTVISIEPTTFNIPPGGSQVFTLTISDSTGAPLVGGTTVTLSATNATVLPSGFEIPDSNFDTGGAPVPGLTQFTVILVNDQASGGDGASQLPASLTVRVESELASGVQCPGGNGNRTLTIVGTVQVAVEEEE